MLKLDVHGLMVQLNIKDFVKSNQDTWDSDWCHVDFSFRLEGVVDYNRLDNEVLLSDEVVDIEEKLTMLLEDQIDQITEIVCIEPDFVFVLYPKKDLRDDPKYTFIQEGYEIEDIFVEWKIYFWNQGLTDNYLTVTLNRKHIKQLRDYLLEVIRKK